MNNPIPIHVFESYLWGAATFLRNKIDAGDYKIFIFPLLLLKRICDVYDEEFDYALGQSEGDPDFASLDLNHIFQIPQNAHWNTLRNCTQNIGIQIQKSMREIEKINPSLFGIFGDANWGNKDRLSDEVLINLIEHFSKIKLSLSNIPNDEMGTGYEYLIKKFADDSGHTAAEFYTNRTVVTLMTQLLDPKSNESIYDPTCGSGGMLLESINYLKRNNKEYRNVKLFGQEKNLLTSSLAKTNLLLHGIEDFKIIRGDTLESPGLLIKNSLQTFNCILANPPYSISKWDQKNWKVDPYGRNLYGTPPKGRADYAFLQHIVASMDKENGRSAILFPHGVLFRDDESEIREKMILDDKVDTIIGLGKDLFYNSVMESCIIILNSDKPKFKRKKILFINGVKEIVRRGNQNFLSDKNIDKIYQGFIDFKNKSDFAHVAEFDEIKNNDWLLSIPLYVKPRVQEITPELSDYSKIWKEKSIQFIESLSTFESDLEGVIKN
jgi:type I restriction enzyme M protein